MPIRVDAKLLKQCFNGANPAVIDAIAKSAQWVLDKHGITANANRLAFFLAQVGHESAGLKILAESLTYTSAERIVAVWPGRFTMLTAREFIRQPRKLANQVYNGRMGNRVGTDDGYNYRGRGPIQITGRDGYRQVGKIAGLPLEDIPELAEKPENAFQIAAAFWTWKNLNPVCDANDFLRCTKLINGGTNGMVDRQAWLNRVLPIVKAAPLSGSPAPLPPPPDIPKPEPKPAPKPIPAPAPQPTWIARVMAALLSIFKK